VNNVPYQATALPPYSSRTVEAVYSRAGRSTSDGSALGLPDWPRSVRPAMAGLGNHGAMGAGRCWSRRRSRAGRHTTAAVGGPADLARAAVAFVPFGRRLGTRMARPGGHRRRAGRTTWVRLW